jgi:6-phosphogluconolactonase
MSTQALAAFGHVQAAAELAITADGRFLYASNRGSQGGKSCIAIFAVAPADGALKALGWEDGARALGFPRHISLAAGDSFVLVSS